MSQSGATGTAIEFGAEQFVKNAAAYKKAKRLVDAIAKYDSLDDAIAVAKVICESLSAQVAKGAGYTPDASLGMGSSNASEIAGCILGIRASDATIRAKFAGVGK